MKRAFFFHFNKPATIKNKKVVISIHYKNTCHLVDNVYCDVPCKGRIRNTQPKFVMCGVGEVVIKNREAFIS